MASKPNRGKAKATVTKPKKYKSVLEEVRAQNKFINFKTGGMFMVAGSLLMTGAVLAGNKPLTSSEFILPETGDADIFGTSLELVIEVGLVLVVIGVGVVVAKLLSRQKKSKK